jgi:putative copper resistance protein D
VSDAIMTTSLLLLSRALHYSAGMVLAGMVAFRWLFLLPGFAGETDATWQKFARLFAWLNRLFVAAGVVLVISGLGMFWAVAAGMSDSSLSDSLSPDTLGAVFFQTQFGTALQWRLVLAAVMAALMAWLAWTRWQARRRVTVVEIAAGIVAAALLVSLAGIGHAAATGGAAFFPRVAADSVHLLATAVWPAGLVPFVLFLGHTRRLEDAADVAPAQRVIQRFSQVSLVVVFLLVATGAINTVFIVGSFEALFTTTYGHVLGVKLLLLLVIVVVATVNRYGVVPRLAQAQPPETLPLLRRLQHLVAVELVLAIGIIIVVSVLGTTAPPQ